MSLHSNVVRAKMQLEGDILFWIEIKLVGNYGEKLGYAGIMFVGCIVGDSLSFIYPQQYG